jgi:predicted negative regulator of RcsB-dependent stress response
MSFEPVMFLLKGDSQCALGKIGNARQSYSQGWTIAQKVGAKKLSALLRRRRKLRG